MEHYTYLLIDLFTILIPFVFSFHPKLQFYKKWKVFFPGMSIVALIFLLWDEYFTAMGVWGFTPRYIMEIYLWDLPLEEILFFICIPYACVFTYHCFDVLNIKPIHEKYSLWISWVLITILGILTFIFYDKYYTGSTFLLLLTSIVYLQFVKKANYLSHFYFTYMILLLPFAITNGILTGSGIEEQVVWYNNSENMGTRIGTIPLEDIFYGMLLILWNVVWMEKYNQSSSSAAG